MKLNSSIIDTRQGLGSLVTSNTAIGNDLCKRAIFYPSITIYRMDIADDTWDLIAVIDEPLIGVVFQGNGYYLPEFPAFPTRLLD